MDSYQTNDGSSSLPDTTNTKIQDNNLNTSEFDMKSANGVNEPSSPTLNELSTCLPHDNLLEPDQDRSEIERKMVTPSHNMVHISESDPAFNKHNSGNLFNGNTPRFKSALLQSMLGGGRLSTRAKDAVAEIRYV